MLNFRRSRTNTPADGLTRPKPPVIAVFNEEEAGLSFAYRARTVAIAAIAIWLIAIVPQPRVYYFLAMAGLLLLLGLIPYRLRHHPYAGLIKVVCILLDVMLLTVVILAPPPFQDLGWPPQVRLRFTDYLYLLVYLCGTALSYSPRLVLCAGLSIVIIWSIGVGIIYALPDTYSLASAQAQGLDIADPAILLRAFLDPHGVSLSLLSNQIALTLVMTGLLTAAVWRGRWHMLRQIEAETARANLSRYFSPDVAAKLARKPTKGMGIAAQRPVAVMFVDMVGFTSLTETMPAEAVILLLRGFHERMANAVFRHEGTLDKYLGDGFMATFGTHREQGAAAERALDCALTLVKELDAWNGERQEQGKAPIDMGIGIHFGLGIVGNVGSGKRLEFTVIGDTVNVASRLERLTREHDAHVAVSGDLIAASGRAAHECGLHQIGPVTLRGRSAPVELYILRRDRAKTADSELTDAAATV